MENKFSDEKKITNDVPLTAELMRSFPGRTETVFDILDEVENGQAVKKLIVTKRDLQPEKPLEWDLARSPRRAFEFHDFESFLRYVVKNHCENSLILADSESLQAVFVYDEKATNGFEYAVYQPTLHPLLKKWMRGTWAAIEFSQFLLEKRASIVGGFLGDDHIDEAPGLSAREVALMFRQIRTSKNVVIESGVGPKSINGVMIEVKIGSSAETQQIAVDLPDRINVRLPIFVNSTEMTDLDFDLLVFNGTGDRVSVSASNSQLDSLIAAEFVSDVQSALDDPDLKVLVTFGKFKTADWQFICSK